MDLGRVDGLDLSEEVSQTLYGQGGAFVERIVSNGHGTGWYDQDHDEWVMVLSGAARLVLGDQDIELGTGEAVTIPAHQRHRVDWTASPTVWVAVHFPA
jgi:cupin 2 domain-containing protein